MIEKMNSAETRIRLCFFKESEVLTFSEVPNPENIDEADEEAEHGGITGLMFVLVVGQCIKTSSLPFLAVARTLSSQKVIKMVAAVISTGTVILRLRFGCGAIF